MFTKNRLSAAIVTVLASAAGANQVLAQEEAALEEVVVTGIRASAQASMDIKRDSPGVVDAITAEDIGKFPDTNLAESLQRITGVSIDRRNGEGFQVTVRGFGPQFNLVTLNGRSLPASQLTLGKSSGGGASAQRSFDMSNIAAEGVSGVEVYKTGAANIASGGIGAAVNLKTRKPLDSEGFVATVGVKALHDTTNMVNADITPELSTFLSWSDDVFGASLAYSYQERDSGESGVFTNAYSAYTGPWTDASFIESVPYEGENGAPDIGVDDVNIVNEPAAGTQTNLTPGIRYYHGDRERKRENAQITFQWAPNDQLTTTLDYTYAEQDIFVNSAELSFWFGGGTFPATDVQFDGRSDVTTPVYFWAENPAGGVRDLGITQNQGHVNNVLKSTGLNIEYLVTDTFTVALDAHTSSSASLPGDGAVGDYVNIALGAQGVWAQGYDNSGDLPLLLGVYRDDPGDGSDDYGCYQDVLDVCDLGSTVRQLWNNRAWADTDQVKLDASWEFAENSSIDFGVEARSLEATQRGSFSQIVLEGNWGVGTPGDVDPWLMRELDYAELFDGYSTSLSDEAQAFFDQAGVDPDNPSGAQAEVFTTGWIANDVSELGQILSFNARLPWAPNPNDGTNRTIKEDITSAYLQASYELDLGAMPLYIRAGVRFEDTEVESIGQVAASTILWQGDNDIITEAGDAADAPITVGTASYSHTLPSINLSLGVTDDIKVRAAYSTTIARPAYNNMLEGINAVQPPNGGPTILGGTPGTAQNGNPALQPLESNNFDLSVEWYYGETSYASIGYFLKDVPNFVGNGVQFNTETPVLDPTNGERAQDAIEALEADPNLAVNQQNLFRWIASESEEGEGCVTNFGEDEDETNSAFCGAPFAAYEYEGTAGWEDNVDLFAVEGDPLYLATLNYPVDTQSAKLDGIELAIQHFFGDSGFGVQANYTVVNGDIEYDITSLETQFALTGLSDTANLVGMFENDMFSVRLAYNWRDDFLVTPTANANEPRQTEAYSQIDMNVNWYVSEGFTVGFEGINLTGEDQRDYARTTRQPLRVDILGARYALSARYTF